MHGEDFSDAALVILGHGSTKNDGSAAPVYQHAAELRRRRIFAAVHEAFWKQEPQVRQVLAGIQAARVFIVPLFVSDGYFSRQVIPRELGFGESPVVHARNQRWFYCHPIGTHDSMTNVLLARAREIVEQFPFPRAPKPKEITLFIAGHGTERNAGSSAVIHRQVELIRALGLYPDVRAIFMEEEPRIAQCYELAQTRNVIVVPFFISDGMHTQEDIPMLLGEPKRVVQQRLEAGQPTWRNPTEKHGKLVWYAPAVGTEPLIAEVILDRAREASQWK